jgi:hypothetical protein
MGKPKRPRDPNQLAKFVVDLATGEISPPQTTDGKDPAAVALGRRGGLKGGKARAEKMPAKERSRIARLAAEARWAKKNGHD